MDAGRECCKGVMWKSSTQLFRVNLMCWAYTLNKQLITGTYKSKGFNNFTICERGKLRHIQSVHITERCVQKSLCRNALKPILVPSLIYDNAASLEGKGTDFALRRMKEHLRRHYQKHGRIGGILLMDYSNYFGSIRHDLLLAMLREKIGDDRIFALTKHFIDAFEGGVGLGLGSEVSQICAIYYPNKIDHHIKEKLHIKGYGRYMDDSYIIHEDMEYLKYCLQVVESMAAELGLKLNRRRVQIVQLAGGHFEYLKKRIHVTETGKIVMRPNRKNITKRRRLLRKHRHKLEQGKIQFKIIRGSQQSWKGYVKRLDAYRSVKTMDEYFDKLFVTRFLRGEEEKMDAEYVKALKRQQEAQNAVMEENERIHEAQLQAAEQNAVDKIIAAVAAE